MSYDLQALSDALQNAHAAGDTAAATALANELVRQQALQAQAAAPPVNPTEGQSFGQNSAQGAGRSLERTAEGLSQILPQGATDLANQMRGAYPKFLGGPLTPIQNPDEATTYDKPLMETGGGKVGNIAGSVAQMLAPGGAATKGALGLGLLRSAPAAAGAATGALFGVTQPTTGDETRAGNTGKEALFGAGGGVIGQGVGAMARGGYTALEGPVKELAQRAANLGIPISAAQLSDSGFVKLLQSALSKLPFSGQGAFYDTQRAAFNKQLAKQMGVEADNLAPETMRAARDLSSSTFTDLAARNNMKVTENSLTRIADVTAKAQQNATTENASLIARKADEILGKSQDGVIPGPAYREFDSELGRMIRGAGNDGDKRFYLGQLRDAVRVGMDESISPADREAWRQARTQYRARMLMENAISKAPDGSPSPALIASAIRQGTKDQAYGGGGELSDLSRIATQFMKNVPGSGTAERMMVYEMLKSMGRTGAGGAAALHYGAMDPSTLMGSLAIGAVGNRALNSQLMARYMQQGLGPQVTPLLEGAGQYGQYLLPAAGGQ